MNLLPSEITFDQTTTKSHQLVFIPLVYDYCVYKLETTIVVSLPQNKSKTSTVVTQGISTLEKLEKFQNGDDVQLEPLNKSWYLVSHDWVKQLSQKGFLNFNKGDLGDWKVYPNNDKIYDEFLIDPRGLQAWVMVQIENESHMVFDIDGKPLATARYFDYIDAGINNGRYDLEKVVDILSQRDDIQFLDNDGDYLDDHESKILDIPYYNAERDRDEYLCFIWAPDQTSYEILWDRCQNLDDEYASCRFNDAIRQLDMLGIESARKS